VLCVLVCYIVCCVALDVCECVVHDIVHYVVLCVVCGLLRQCGVTFGSSMLKGFDARLRARRTTRMEKAAFSKSVSCT
jgi:hypothetical protein